MNITLVRAGLEDARALWQMQVEAFSGLLAKYQDFDTNPGGESIEKVQQRLSQTFTYYYYICMDGIKAGAIRIVDTGTPDIPKRVSPLYILPAYRRMGLAQKAMGLCEAIHGSRNWELETILQEDGNCRLYEKLGYSQTPHRQQVNDKMTLVTYIKP